MSPYADSTSLAQSVHGIRPTAPLVSAATFATGTGTADNAEKLMTTLARLMGWKRRYG